MSIKAYIQSSPLHLSDASNYRNHSTIPVASMAKHVGQPGRLPVKFTPKGVVLSFLFLAMAKHDIHIAGTDSTMDCFSAWAYCSC